MCRNCVVALDSIGKIMSEHLKSGYAKAVMEDLFISSDEEPIMVQLVAYEINAESLKDTIDSILIGELLNMLDNAEDTPVFTDKEDIEKWA